VGIISDMDTSDPNVQAAPSPPARARPRRAVVIGLAVAALAVFAAGWHLSALRAYDASALPGPTAARLDAARLAAGLEPWSAAFAWRVIALRGLTLLEQGKIDPAYFLVEPYSVIVHGTDATFVAIYQEIVAIKTPIDSGKAHVAHGLDPLLDFGPGVARPATRSAPATTP
jgi:hypothetical protein